MGQAGAGDQNMNESGRSRRSEQEWARQENEIRHEWVRQE
jgi:hypothetical protein